MLSDDKAIYLCLYLVHGVMQQQLQQLREQRQKWLCHIHTPVIKADGILLRLQENPWGWLH